MTPSLAMSVMSAVPMTETASANGLNHLHRNLGTTTSSAVVALVITQTETVVPGVPEVTVTGLRISFLLSGLAALLALALASLLRRGTNGDGHADQGVPVAGAAEFVVSGRIEGMDEVAPPRAAVVAAMDFRGRQVDWSRTDAQGQFSIVVLNPGRYVLVVAARGRAAYAQRRELEPDTAGLFLGLGTEIALTGVARIDGEPRPGAFLSLVNADGVQVAVTSSDVAGRFRFVMPSPGNYLLTAVHPDSGAVTARKLQLSPDPLVLDLEPRSATGPAAVPRR